MTEYQNIILKNSKEICSALERGADYWLNHADAVATINRTYAGDVKAAELESEESAFLAKMNPCVRNMQTALDAISDYKGDAGVNLLDPAMSTACTIMSHSVGLPIDALMNIVADFIGNKQAQAVLIGMATEVQRPVLARYIEKPYNCLADAQRALGTLTVSPEAAFITAGVKLRESVNALCAAANVPLEDERSSNWNEIRVRGMSHMIGLV